MPNPPEVAELILRGLLPRDMGETVSGDLLEEYRESRVPAAGEFRADLWYWRQVGGMWLRAYWWLVVYAVLYAVACDVVNTFRPAPRLAFAVISPLGILVLVGLTTLYGSWRTQRWQGGFVAALGLSAIVWLFMVIWSIATFYPFAHAAQSNPAWIGAWQWSVQHGHAPRHQSFVRWLYWDNVGSMIIAGLVLLVTSFLCGGIGALVGEFFPSRDRGRTG